MFSPTPLAADSRSCSILSVAIRCSAQALALVASVSLHVSGGDPTTARSRLCTVRTLLTKSAVFTVLPLVVGEVGKVALLSVEVVVVPPPVDDEPLLSVVVVPPPLDESSLLSVD